MDMIYEELGICYIATNLRKNGHKVKIESVYYKDFNEDYLLDKPDVVGFCVYSVNKNNVYDCIHITKNIVQDIKVVLGGYHPTLFAEEMMNECEEIDFIIKGPGEIVFNELLQNIDNIERLKKINNLVFKDINRVFVTQEVKYENHLLSIWPDRDLLQKLAGASIFTSFSCAGACSFCHGKTHHGHWLGRDVEDVVNEVEYINNHYNKNIFRFADSSLDNPKMNFNRVRNIADEIINRNLNIHYYAFFRAEFFSNVNEELLKKLICSGLRAVFIGIEAGNRSDIKLYNKTAKVEDNENCLKTLYNNGIYAEIGFINFNLYSTLETITQNSKFLYDSKMFFNMLYITNRLILFKGTPIYRKALRDGLIDGQEFDEKQDIFVDLLVKKLYSHVSNIKDKNYILLNSLFETINRNMFIMRILSFEYPEEQDIAATIAKYRQLMDTLNEANYTWFCNLIRLISETNDIPINEDTYKDALKIISLSFLKINRKTKSLYDKLKKNYRDGEIIDYLKIY